MTKREQLPTEIDDPYFRGSKRIDHPAFGAVMLNGMCCASSLKESTTMLSSYLPGYGDEATWGPYTGHPNDPRAPDLDTEDFDIDEVEEDIRILGMAEYFTGAD